MGRKKEELRMSSSLNTTQDLCMQYMEIPFLKITVVNNSYAQLFRGEMYRCLQPTLK